MPQYIPEETNDSLSEPLSYWQQTHPYAHLVSSHISSTHILVIGAGLLGASTAYWLARAGHHVTVLERAFPAYGATGRNGGFVSIGPDEAYSQAITRLGDETAHTILHITLENQALIHQVLAEELIECDYREPGHLHLALAPEELDTFQQSRLMLHQEGIPTYVLHQEEMQAFVHTPIGPSVLGAWFVPQAGLVHPMKLVQGLVHAAQRYGAQFVAAEALNLHPEGDGVLLHTTQGPLFAHNVLVANNAWLPEVLPSLKTMITPVRGQVLAYHRMPSLFSTGVTVDLAGSESYWQQTLDGTIILGGCRATAEGYDIGIRVSQPTHMVQTALEHILPSLFPHLEQLHVAHRWAGLMVFTPDLLPIVDRVRELPNTWVVGGFSGHGMPYGVRFGQLLAELLTSTKPSPMLAPFQLCRATLKNVVQK